MNVTFGPDIEKRIAERVAKGEYESADILVQRAVRRLLNAEAEAAITDRLLREAEESGDYIELNAEEWDKIEREALTLIETRRAAFL